MTWINEFERRSLTEFSVVGELFQGSGGEKEQCECEAVRS